MLSALDPGKQGLKLRQHDPMDALFSLSALDPGKQGLKHAELALGHDLAAFFQRLIQENKD